MPPAMNKLSMPAAAAPAMSCSSESPTKESGRQNWVDQISEGCYIHCTGRVDRGRLPFCLDSDSKATEHNSRNLKLDI
eukprot:1159104-Pelagomonas_calceolata.AAC.1